MKATRTLPGRPVNSTSSVVTKIINLVAKTLDHSPSLDVDEIRAELRTAATALGLLCAGGHLRRGELVLVVPGLRLRIDVPVGEDAFASRDHMDPPRGAATADDWSLHLPVPDCLATVVKAASRSCRHISLEPAPTEAPPRKWSSLASTIDLSRLADMRGRP